MGALADFGSRVVEHDPFDCVLPVQLDRRRAVLRRAEGEPDVLEAARQAKPAFEVRLRRCAQHRRRRALPASGSHGPAGVPRTGFDDRPDRDAGRERRAYRKQRALCEQVGRPNLHRVHAQRLCQAVHLPFGGERGLRAAETTEGPVRQVVGVDRVRVDGDVGEFVRPGAHQRGIAQHLGRRVRVGAPVLHELHPGGNELALAGGAPARTDHERVPLVVAENRLLARPDDLDRASDPALLQAPGGQRQDDLDRHVLAAAEGAADGRVDDPNLIQWHAQRMRDLLLVLVRPLPRHLDQDPSGLIKRSDAGLGLQVGMLLRRRAILVFDDQGGARQPGPGVALADAEVAEDIRAAFRVQHRSVGAASVQHIRDHRQIFILDGDAPHAFGGNRFGVGHHQRHLVAHKAHAVCPRLGRARAAQHRLVRQEQTVLVDRHVPCGQYRQHTWKRLGGRGVDAPHDRVRPAGKQDLHRRRVRRVQVPRIRRRPGDLGVGIDPVLRLTYRRHPATFPRLTRPPPHGGLPGRRRAARRSGWWRTWGPCRNTTATRRPGSCPCSAACRRRSAAGRCQTARRAG